jgi:hypothetical protein
MGRKKKTTFCEQKVAKKLWSFGACGAETAWTKRTKVFAPIFSKSGRFP